MKVLVIPDIHLKPYIFAGAREIMNRGEADIAVCLMDIPDDWGKEYALEEYANTYDAAIAFAKEFPDSLWCYGNHDLCYMWDERESGYSSLAKLIVQRKLMELNMALPPENPIQYVHKIDNVLFCHGGILQYFVDKHVPLSKQEDVSQTVDIINSLGHYEMWCDDSPIWHRPQGNHGALYMADKYLQVVGHTPVNKLRRDGNVISCDVFSTYPNGTSIGTQELLLLDTQTWEFEGRHIAGI